MDQLMGTMNMVIYLSYGIAALVIVFVIIAVGRLVRGGARNRQLLQSGESATATIVELRDTGTTVNDNPQVELVLDVLPAGRPPFRATARTLISRLQTSQVQPGMQVLVKFDPSDTSKVALAGFAGVAART
jgi:hypothetical protein